MARPTTIAPFARRGRSMIAAILLTFAISGAATVALSIWETSKSRHRAAVFQVAARQQTLADRYVAEVILARAGEPADPRATARIRAASARALLNGGTAPELPGNDDQATLAAQTGLRVRRQLRQEQRLVHDLSATGAAILAGRPVLRIALTARERPATTDPITRLRILAALTANVSLNAERTITTASDATIDRLIRLQVILGALGLIITLGLALLLIRATRRQTAHFRSLVTSSTDLVLVIAPAGCVYAGRAVLDLLGCAEEDVLHHNLLTYVHPDDRESVDRLRAHVDVPHAVIRVRTPAGEWRHLEANVTDLRRDRHVRGVVLNARDITARLNLEAELTRQAFHDALTGLPNRVLLRDRLAQALARSGRNGSPVSVLLIDLDGFKQVNDTLGHDAGDELLRAVGERLAAVARGHDTLARLGGDEFALLAEGAGEAEATAIAERVLAAVTHTHVVGGREFRLGASIGIVTRVGDAGDPAELLRHADVAMYAAKGAGRGRFEVFRPEMAAAVGERVGMEHALRIAVARRDLRVAFQPEYHVGDGSIAGAEALARWHSPSRGEVPPSEFITVAESMGLIPELGAFVLDEACARTAAWERDGLLPRGFTIWVNVSVHQLEEGGLGELVEQTLRRHGLAAAQLGIEITESAVVGERAAAETIRAELQRIRQLGVRIAIDDFGTGFSSLGQLRHLPLDVLKLDRSFVAGVADDPRDAALAANVIDLSRALGVLTVAEGVETPAQLQFLREHGCELAQGFLFSRPIGADQIVGLLRRARPADERKAA